MNTRPVWRLAVVNYVELWFLIASKKICLMPMIFLKEIGPASIQHSAIPNSAYLFRPLLRDALFLDAAFAALLVSVNVAALPLFSSSSIASPSSSLSF